MKRRAYLSGYVPAILTNELRDFFASCYPQSLEWCAHEIGHILYDASEEPLLPLVDAISERSYGVPPATPPSVFRSDGRPFDMCREIVEEAWRDECFIGIGHNAFLFSEFDPEHTFVGHRARCMTLAEEADRPACEFSFMYRIGLHYGAPLFLVGRYDDALAVCQHAADEGNAENAHLRACYRGIGSGVGTHLLAESALREESRVSLTLAPELAGTLSMCNEAPPSYRDACYDGIVSRRGFAEAYERGMWRSDSINHALARLQSAEIP
jgi:hypothetical protein